MRTPSLILVIALALSLADAAAQAPQPGTLTGTLTIKTQGATTAVLGKNPDKGDFMFCISQDRTAPQAIDFSGPGRVIYKPKPPLDMPEGVTIEGPEMVESTLVVIAEDGQAWLFVGKGQKPLLPASDPALARAKTVQVRGLQRSDWAPQNGRRRGTDLQGCLAPGG